MDNHDRLELRRLRMAQSPALLRGGFRPFFLGAGAWAPIAIAIWLWAFDSGSVRIGALDPLAWHRHEMLFGFVGAAIAGFALTAVPNWTGRLPIAGAPLAGLALWWLAARLLLFAMPQLPLSALALIDGGFYLGLALLILREIVQAKNRNVPVALIIALFGVTDLLDYAGIGKLIGPDIGAHSAIALAIILISLIGGRIVPSFTRNWMQGQQMAGNLPSQPGRFDLGVILATAIALLVWVITGLNAISGALLVIAGMLQIARLARWQGWRTASSPIVVILHMAYLWIPIGLLLLAAAGLGWPVPRSAGIHALTAGAMANMILAVMTRATLGHTGRALNADLPTTLCYAAIQLGVIARVLASLIDEYYRPLLHAAGGLWIAAFAFFLIAYAPILLSPRAD